MNNLVRALSVIILCGSLSMNLFAQDAKEKADKEKPPQAEKAEKPPKPEIVLSDATLNGTIVAKEFTRGEKQMVNYYLQVGTADAPKQIPLRHVYVKKVGDEKVELKMANYVGKTVTLQAKVVYDKDGTTVRKIVDVNSLTE